MDIRSYFGSSSKPSTLVPSSSSSSDSSSEKEIEAPPTKKPCVSKPLKKRLKYCTTSSSSRKYKKRWEIDFPWLKYDADCEGAFCQLCKTSGQSLERRGGV